MASPHDSTKKSDLSVTERTPQPVNYQDAEILARDEVAPCSKPEEGSYPEGGVIAWLSVVGSLCGMMCCFGLMNTIGTFQAYISRNQLKSYSQADVGWIFSLYLFIAYFSGIVTGSLFDAQGPKILMVSGTVCLVACMFLLGVCTQYYQFILVFSILGGLGTSLVSSPAIASIGHFFNKRRGFASGIACCGGSLGGIIFPLMLSSLFASVGFGWATRALGFLFLALLIVANLLIRSRLPSQPLSYAGIVPDPKIFKDITFLIVTIAIFLIEWGLFIPLNYLTSFALSNGVEPALSYQLMAILNAGSFFGRWLPGLLADRIGRFNTMILMILLCLVTTLAFWLAAALTPDINKTRALLIVFAVLFGFASGSNISLGPVCAGQLCETKDYGRYFATMYTVVGIGTLVGIPIVGEILIRCHGSYVGLIGFTGASYATGLGFFAWARVRVVGWGLGREQIY